MDNLTGWRRIAVGIVATIVLGAIGSGVWELAGRSATQWVGRAILTGVTLGSSAIRDSVYREAARGFHEAASLYIVGLISALVSGFWGVTAGYWTASRLRPDTDDIEAIAAVEDPQQRMIMLNASIATSKAAVKSAKRKLAIAVSVGLFVIGAMQFINYLKLSQANEALTYYNQAFKICSPYMGDQDAKLVSSRFAAMQGRADYVTIVAYLGNVASSNGRKLPSYSPW